MKPIFLAGLALVLLVMLSACAGSTAGVPVPTVSSTAAPMATATATAVPTVTPVSLQQAAGQAVCAPPSAPTPRPTIEYRKECITIEDSVPADLHLKGALLLSDGWYNTAMYHMDLRSLRKSPFPYYHNYTYRENSSLSPDGKWLAYFELKLDEKGHQKERYLQVVNAEGRHLDMSYWTMNWQYLVGWQDNQHLILFIPGPPWNTFVILNPFTRQKEPVHIDVPGLYDVYGEWRFLNLMKEVVPSPDLAYWVRQDKDQEINIWRLIGRNRWNTIWKGDFLPSWFYGFGRGPSWSPNGRFFTMMGYYNPAIGKPDGGILLKVGVDGETAPLSNQVGLDSALSWSPNSRFIAGWLNLGVPDTMQHDFPNHLVLIDVEKPLLTDLCYENQGLADFFYTTNTPVWSPDGRFLAIGVAHNEEKEYGPINPDGKRSSYEIAVPGTVLIDLQAKRAYQLFDDAIPWGWMSKPGE